MEPPVVEASGLRVAFPSPKGPVEALRGLDLRLGKGDLFVLLGPNGAGKTTLMRCITGLLRPASGTVRVFGAGGPGDGAPGRAREDRLRRIGVLIENPGVYGRLDAREYLSFFAGFYGTGRDPARVDSLCEAFGLALDRKPVARLSQGNRQKLHLVRSLLHSPELLLWDEPTDHLDPEAQARVLGYLRRYVAEAGAAALVATHRLEQMEGVGTHFGFLKAGALAAAGPRGEVLAGGVARARVALAEEAHGAVARAAEGLGLSAERDDDGPAWEVTGPDLEGRIPALVRNLVLGGHAVKAVEPRRPGLAEVYARVMGDG